MSGVIFWAKCNFICGVLAPLGAFKLRESDSYRVLALYALPVLQKSSDLLGLSGFLESNIKPLRDLRCSFVVRPNAKPLTVASVSFCVVLLKSHMERPPAQLKLSFSRAMPLSVSC